MEEPLQDAETPLTPRDRGWWSAFGNALLSGEFENAPDPETLAFIDDWRRRVLDGAGGVFAAVTDGRLEAMASELSAIEERLARIEQRLDSGQDSGPDSSPDSSPDSGQGTQRTTPTA